MAVPNQSSSDPLPPFTQYVKDLRYRSPLSVLRTDLLIFCAPSVSYPELGHLAGLLTGQYTPSTTCLTWTTPSNVDVVIVDIKTSQEKPTTQHIRDVESLKRAADLEIPCDVSLRLFLVEDMSAPVVEVLGGAFSCYPHLFANHMQTIGARPQYDIDGKGLPVQMNLEEPLCPNPGRPRSTSEIADLPYFSVPFRRHFQYASEQHMNLHRTRRTMFRLYHEGEDVLEERVSGALHSTGTGAAKIGKLPIVARLKVSFYLIPFGVIIQTASCRESIANSATHFPDFPHTRISCCHYMALFTHFVVRSCTSLWIQGFWRWSSRTIQPFSGRF